MFLPASIELWYRRHYRYVPMLDASVGDGSTPFNTYFNHYFGRTSTSPYEFQLFWIAANIFSRSYQHNVLLIQNYWINQQNERLNPPRWSQIISMGFTVSALCQALEALTKGLLPTTTNLSRVQCGSSGYAYRVNLGGSTMMTWATFFLLLYKRVYIEVKLDVAFGVVLPGWRKDCVGLA